MRVSSHDGLPAVPVSMDSVGKGTGRKQSARAPSGFRNFKSSAPQSYPFPSPYQSLRSIAQSGPWCKTYRGTGCRVEVVDGGRDAEEERRREGLEGGRHGNHDNRYGLGLAAIFDTKRGTDEMML